ncbi:MAG: hypothetical protein EPO51_24230 [Phenylobacterium sp.]|uniref:hypothetical protein n=1 Tax=Phenylobacterium sp. TaxID=1871053 RepID=UPI0012210DEB|nr:hypothetical protein [Phenylobacterium sp.]TAJ69145.1 MAG: hypothetical protein EPO51_24230 [Phenylobacterium sp.]
MWFADKVLPSLITGLIIAIVGSWLIARAVERFRGQRDYLNRALDAVRTQLLALQKLAGQYWTSNYKEAESTVQEAEIEFLIQDISSLCAACAPHLWKGKDSDGPALVASLAAAVTGPTFGQRNRPKELWRAREVQVKASQLMRRLTHDRTRYFADRTLKQQIESVRWLWPSA